MPIIDTVFAVFAVLFVALWVSPILYMIIWAGIWTGREWAITRILGKKGLSVSGLIVDRKRRKGAKSNSYTIFYNYNAPDNDGTAHLYHGKQRVGPLVYEGLAGWTDVDVTYLPKHPRVSRLDDEEMEHTVRNFTTVVCIALAIIFPPLLLIEVFAYLFSVARYDWN
jgi:hypothetical protein